MKLMLPICDLLSHGAPVLRLFPDPSFLKVGIIATCSSEGENHWRIFAGKRIKISKMGDDSDVPSINSGMWYAGIMALFSKPAIPDSCPPGQGRASYILSG